CARGGNFWSGYSAGALDVW
nr:immunoglobulin heavy chain junction region [Macaca mulatta]MOX63727.1 immunoglobulin heavy chain junction region [Macaca mulatta]MOX65616.1 immunoglobulin heavy chain junction region [Macaca mulatta]MOX67697.1 immunoglobulin heavy chain junction region [Macaca mulatta]MOX68578.1 immunoglobulin heavy chain junction region [Macaca mulatta]